MKTSKISLSMAIFMFAGALTFTSCKKKETTTPQSPDNEQSSATDNALAENSSNDIISMGSQVSENGGSFSTYRSADPNVNVNSIDNNELMLATACTTIMGNAIGTVVATSYTVDFGAAPGCSGLDGRVRSGKLIYDFSGSTNGAKHYRNPGFKMTVTSVNYVVDGNQININNKTVTNTSSVPLAETAFSSDLTWNITANISIVKANNGGTISWNCTRTKELTNSNDPTCYKGQLQAIDWTKATIKLNGNASGTNNKGEAYTANATDLVRSFTCHPDGLHPKKSPFIGGSIDYKPGTRANRHIDYGNGTDCDLTAVVTINGQSWTITLP